jgi:predicted transcriptional regulator
MITTKKRGKFEIYGDILEAIIDEQAEWGQGARLTRVQAKTNLAYDRFRRDLARLEERKLVQIKPDKDGNSLIALTQAGAEYVEHYRGVKKFLAMYGL